MWRKLNILIPFLLMLACLIPALLGKRGTSVNDLAFQREEKAFEKKLHEKMALMQQFLDNTAQQIAESEKGTTVWQNLDLSADQLATEGDAWLVYRHDSLVYWSDNAFSLDDSLSRYSPASSFVFLGNGWFVKLTGRCKDYVVTGLILISADYPIENRFIANGFQKDFEFSREVKLGYLKDIVPGSYIVAGLKGERLFFIHPTPLPISPGNYLTISGLWYLLSFLFLLLLLRGLMKNLAGQGNKIARFSFILLFLLALRYVMVYWKVPEAVYQLDIFQPRYFASSSWLPSLGDLVLNSLILFFLVYVFYVEFPVPSQKKGSTVHNRLSVYITLALLVLAGLYPDYIYRTLVQNSRISFEIHNLFDISPYSFLAMLPVALLYASLALLADKWILFAREVAGRNRLLTLYVISNLLLFLITKLAGLGFDPLSLLLYLLIFALVCYIRYSAVYHFRYSTFLVLILLFSVFSALFSSKYMSRKMREEQKVLAVNLADEHDPVAELLINDVEKWMRDDKLIQQLIFKKDFGVVQFGQLENYLGKRYFNDYWLKYNFEVTVCSSRDSVFIQPDSVRADCYSFFEDMIRERGIQIPNTDIYYLDNRNGRISYFFTIPYHMPPREVRLFITLDSRLISEELGYPELLIDDDMKKENPLAGYSYAKYYKGKLIMKSGLFAYSLNSDEFRPGSDEFSSTMLGRYDHLLYRVDKDNLIVLSRPVLTSFDRLVAFSYVFVFYFLLATLLLLLARVPFIQLGFKASLKNRIQYSMIILLFLSLLLVGGGSVYFSIKQYNDKHREILSEKLQSVYVELEHYFLNLKMLGTDWQSEGFDSLEELLKRFSNVFYTDINLYDPHGVLLASSRPEIFANHLLGRRMNPLAFRELAIRDRAQYIQREKIGSMAFLSAYVPFINSENKLLAYLNLPYFTRQTLLSEEVSSLVVAVVNISILLILLSTAFTIFIANQITRPLNVIQKKFSEMELGRKYEKIAYHRKDEIGNLVKEYNRMVEELQKNIDLIARSERESAWREMAKQVAHEIKNPLTPMKLSVQHLERTWEKRPDNFDEYLKKFINTIVEQIDNLSYIATAFSNFAMMPREINEELDFLEVINHALHLFSNQENLDIASDYHGLLSARVYADREQLMRVLVNLFKNAQQAVPESREAKIRIGLKQSGDFYVFSISDNGVGIPESLKNRMFEPNFTTKSSGMGLGLAMSKKIIENAGGTISFRTEEGKGTTFSIALPLIH